MSKTSQHGRRRADSSAAASTRSLRLRRAGLARTTAVAAAGALLITIGATQQPVSADATTESVSAVSQSQGPISVPASLALSFDHADVSSAKAPSATPNSLSQTSSKVEALGAGGGPVNDPAGAKAFAGTQLASFGWGQDQMACLLPLWTRESDWTTTAENASSLAYGIAQSLPAEKMNAAGNDWRNNYQTQIKWGLGYIKDRYGSPCGAWDHETAIGWY